MSHILLGLIQLESDPATQWLANAGVDLSKAKTELEDLLLLVEHPNVHVSLHALQIHVEQPKVIPGRLPTNDAYNCTLLLALKEAEAQGLQEITTMCVLLAILRLPENLPANVLARYNVKYEILKGTQVPA